MGAFRRHITTDQIKKHLMRFGVSASDIHIQHEPSEREGIVRAPLSVDGTTFMLSVDPRVEIQQLDVVVSRLLHATLDDTPADRVHGLLLAIGALNYRFPLGCLAYDPRDGEVALRYGMPILDEELPYEVFERVLVVFQNILSNHVDDLRAVVAGDRTAREILR